MPPSKLSVTFHGNPCIHKLSGAIRHKLVERHDHTGIVATISFDSASHYSWFSSFATKWSLGVKGIQGNHPFWDLSDRKCPACDEAHPLDVISTVALCPAMSQHLGRLADAWGPNLSPRVHGWLAGNRSRGELRNFARTLVAKSLFDVLAPDKEQRAFLKSILPERRRQLTAAIKDICLYRREHPAPDPLPPPLTANTFFDSWGPYSNSDRPAARRQHIYHPPAPLPQTVKSRSGGHKRQARPPPVQSSYQTTSERRPLVRSPSVLHFPFPFCHLNLRCQANVTTKNEPNSVSFLYSHRLPLFNADLLLQTLHVSSLFSFFASQWIRALASVQLPHTVTHVPSSCYPPPPPRCAFPLHHAGLGPARPLPPQSPGVPLLDPPPSTLDAPPPHKR